MPNDEAMRAGSAGWRQEDKPSKQVHLESDPQLERRRPRWVAVAAAALVLSANAFAEAPSSSGSTAEEAFVTKVKSLEERVSDLKEKILLSKMRLLSLQEKVLGGDLSNGARVVLVHKKELSPAYYLVSVSYVLDGAPVKTRVDENGDLNQSEEFEIFNGPIVPGNHQLSVKMVLKGGTRGLFSYAADYSFTTSASFTFNAEATKLTTVNAVAYEKGGFTAQLQDRPGFRFETQVTRDGAPRSSGVKESASGPEELKR